MQSAIESDCNARRSVAIESVVLSIGSDTATTTSSDDEANQAAACTAEAATVRTAVEAYDAEYSMYPTSLTQLYTPGGKDNFLGGDDTELVAWTPSAGGDQLRNIRLVWRLHRRPRRAAPSQRHPEATAVRGPRSAEGIAGIRRDRSDGDLQHSADEVRRTKPVALRPTGQQSESVEE